MDAASQPHTVRARRASLPSLGRRRTAWTAVVPAPHGVPRRSPAWTLGLALAAILRLPAFAWGVISDDEGIYDAMAQAVRHGGCMYRDVLDHKPPGLVYLYAWVQSLAEAALGPRHGMDGVHALGLLAAVATAWGLALVGRLALNGPSRAWPPLLFAASSTAKCAYDGLAVNGELLMGVPSVLALAALLEARRRRGRGAVALDVAAGALVGAAGLVKWQAMVLGLTFALFGPRPWRGALARVVRRGPLWAAGLALPLGCSAAYFAAQGVLGAAWAWGVVYNLQYVAEGPDGLWALRRLAVQLLVVVAPAALFYGAGLRGTFGPAREVRSEAALGLRVWALGCALAVCVGGRFFGHYFLQLELPLCVLGAPVCARLWARRPRATVAGLAAPVAFFFAFSASPAHMRRLLNGQDPDWVGVGRVLQAHSRADESLFVWGNAPLVYHYAAREMGTRFAFCNYLTGLSPGTRSEYQPEVRPENCATPAWSDLFDDLEARRPVLLLDTATAGWKGYGKFPLGAFPQLARYVAEHYRDVGQLSGATLYRRVDAGVSRLP